MLLVDEKEASGDSRFVILPIPRPTGAFSFPTSSVLQKQSMAKGNVTGRTDFAIL